MSDSLRPGAHRDGAIIDVTVQPRASRSEIVGPHDGALRVRLAAPPVDGAANAELIALLAKSLGIPKSRIDIVHGLSSRRKRVLVREMTPDTLVRELERALGG